MAAYNDQLMEYFRNFLNISFWGSRKFSDQSCLVKKKKKKKAPRLMICTSYKLPLPKMLANQNLCHNHTGENSTVKCNCVHVLPDLLHPMLTENSSLIVMSHLLVCLTVPEKNESAKC